MKLLILKDFYTQKASIFFVCILWFIIITNFFTDGSPVRHVLLIIMVAFFLGMATNGENTKAFRTESVLINSLPCTRKQIILAKYLSGFMWFGLAAIAVIIYVMLFDIFAPFPTRMFHVNEIILALSGFYILLSIFYPVLFRAGYVVASVISFTIPFIVFIGAQMVMNIIENPRLTSAHEMFAIIASHLTSITVVFAVVSLLITWLSYKISLRIYTKMDF